ncbi:MAG: spore maturation protein [Clostridia bacterium]|nr:spore maturation protein [Clostridia bacterium]
MKYVIPLLILAITIVAAVKKVPLYDGFVGGVKKAFPLVVKIFPYVLTVLIMCEVMEQSGLSGIITNVLSPVFGIFGIPKELIKLVLVKPFSGSGSLAVLSETLSTFGADSYIGRCASVIFGSSETTFYVGAVYFASCKKKNLVKPIIISLVSTFISTVFAVFICKIM